MRKLTLYVLPAVLAGALFSSACNKKDAAATGEPANKDAAAKPAEPPKPMPAELPDVVARVNGQDVKKEDFEMLVRNLEMGGPIPAERREDVFKPFVRLDEARNQDAGGTGLGLAIARDIARSHGGDITLDTSPMGGLRAVVRVPA